VPENCRVEFIQSEFGGQLPKHFDASSDYPARIVPSHMNDQNKEEPSRYVDLAQCHLIIDSKYDHYQGKELPYSRDASTWSIVESAKVLDNSRSSKLFRAFYVPPFSNRLCTYIDYNLLMRNKAN